MLGGGVDPNHCRWKTNPACTSWGCSLKSHGFSRFYQHPRWFSRRISGCHQWYVSSIQPKTAASRPTNCAFLDSWMLHACKNIRGDLFCMAPNGCKNPTAYLGLVGGFSPTHLEKICASQIRLWNPKLRGANSKNIWVGDQRGECFPKKNFT